MRVFHSLFFKLLFCLLLISILPLSIVGYLIYENTASKLTENVNYHANYLLEQKGNSLNQLHSNLEKMGKGLVTNLVFSDFTENTNYKKHQQLFLELDKLLISLENLFPQFQGITLINEEEFLYHYGYSIEQSVEANDILQSDWFLQAGGEKLFKVTPLHESHYSLPYESPPVYSFIYEGWDRKLRNRSIIIIDFTKDHLSGILEASSENIKLAGSLVYDNQEFVYKNDKAPSFSYQEVASSSSGSYVTDQTSKSEYIIYKQEVPALGWTIVEYFNVNDLYKPVQDIRDFFIITILISIIICIAASIFVTNKISQPIYKLRKKMKEVEKGNFQEETITNAKDVIGDLASGFNHMLVKIKALMKTLEKEEKLKREAEITALQLQINPHFIYNTLESINSLARKSKQYEISNLIVLLGRLLRMSISSFEEKVSISKELLYIQYYLEIQQKRMRYPLEFYINVPPELQDVKIVKWIFQPLVENAIIHGIDPKRAPAHIFITGKQQGENIIFEIIDDGVGIESSQLTNIQKQLKSNSPELAKYQGRIGMHNVQSRILLHYGNDYGMDIQSEEGFGTKIRMILPGRRDKNGENADCG